MANELLAFTAASIEAVGASSQIMTDGFIEIRANILEAANEPACQQPPVRLEELTRAALRMETISKLAMQLRQECDAAAAQFAAMAESPHWQQ